MDWQSPFERLIGRSYPARNFLGRLKTGLGRALSLVNFRTCFGHKGLTAAVGRAGDIAECNGHKAQFSPRVNKPLNLTHARQV